MDWREGHGRDILIAVVVVGGILLALYAYTGNWPPPVVIESNSMMHVDAQEYEENVGDTRGEDVPYGRFGTIDPGDLVLVKKVGGPEEVDTFADGGDEHYGKAGEVVVYFRFGDQRVTPIIHRAMTYVDRTTEADGDRRYDVRWSPTWGEPEGNVPCHMEEGTRVCTFGESGITIPELKLRNKHFQHSGFITQGDNVVGNQAPDQVLGIMSEPVKAEWIQGVARGELPWFGLIKLMLTSPDFKNQEVADHPYYWSIGKMTAPKDLWVMLFTGLVVVAGLPVAVDYGVHYLRTRQEEDEEVGGLHGLDPPGRPDRDEPGPGDQGAKDTTFRPAEAEEPADQAAGDASDDPGDVASDEPAEPEPERRGTERVDIDLE